MRRALDVFAILCLIGFFLLGLFGNPGGEGWFYLQFAALVAGALALAWIAGLALSALKDVRRKWQSIQVAQARLTLKDIEEKDLEAVFDDYARHDWKRCGPQLWKHAEKGEPRAQYTVSHLFRRGLGVPRSPAEGVRWLWRAAEQGHTEAEAELGEAFVAGYDGALATDPAIALEWLRRAADKSHDGATCNIAAMFEYGIGVLKDRAEAANWYRRAAERGDLKAQTRLGRLYLHGGGIGKDPVQAYVWLKLAAERLGTTAAPDWPQRQRELAEARISMSPEQSEQSRWLTQAWTDRMVKVDPEVIERAKARAREKRRIMATPFVDRIRGELQKIRAEQVVGLPAVIGPSPMPGARTARAPLQLPQPAVPASLPQGLPRPQAQPMPLPVPAAAPPVPAPAQPAAIPLTLRPVAPAPAPQPPAVPPQAAPKPAAVPEPVAAEAREAEPARAAGAPAAPMSDADQKTLADLKAQMRARRAARGGGSDPRPLAPVPPPPVAAPETASPPVPAQPTPADPVRADPVRAEAGSAPPRPEPIRRAEALMARLKRAQDQAGGSASARLTRTRKKPEG